MSNNPLAEVFGFPSNSFSEQAQRYRRNKLCPYNNKVPNCTKDKANDPLGVCSIYHRNAPVVGKIEDFIEILQQKLDDKLDNPPDTQTILDNPLQ
jgi:hypothetical protein